MKCFVLAVLLAYPAIGGQSPQSSGAAMQQPSSSERPTPAVLSGRVLNAKTGEPIRRANVVLRPFGSSSWTGSMVMAPPGAAPYAATTNAEGKFRIDAVEPGSYQIMAERQGFVRQTYGSRGGSMIGATIRVTPGQELKDLDIKMTPQAVVTGRVLDEDGEPLEHVQIQVLQRRYLEGRSRFMPSGGGQTTDTGEFRVADLRPGSYWISATYPYQMGMFGDAPARNASGKPEEKYVTTYYPGVTDPAEARPVELVAGQELPGIDIRMQKARVYRIRGKVVSGAQLPRSLRVLLLPRDRNVFIGFFGAGATVKPDGTFEIGNVQPGSYYLSVLPTQEMRHLVGKAPVDVTRENVENVTLTLGAGATLNGSIRIDGDSTQLEATQGKKITLEGASVQLTPLEGLAFNVPNTSVKGDGSFALENVGPERYRIHVFNLPQGLWLKSIRAGDREVLDTGLDLSAGPPSDLIIVLGLGAASITGTVLDDSQQPVSGSLVTLAPDSAKEERRDLYHVAPTDQNGRFSMTGIAPGQYKLYAWEDVAPGSYMDPEFLKAHERQGQKITIGLNDQQQVSLKLIPSEAVAQ